MSSLKKQGKVYWRSLAELAEEPEFRRHLENEFAAPPMGDDPSSFSRRRFMQLMGASVALATGSACRWEKEHILPFTRRPDGHIPGVPQFYATAMELGGYAEGLVATSYDGRPIKLEGNPAHPVSQGGTGAYAQASILELYDPDRSQAPCTFAQGMAVDHTTSEFRNALADMMALEQSSGGQGLRVLSEASHSPTLEALKARFLAAYPKAKWLEYEALSRDNERLGTQMVFGMPLRAHGVLSKAQVVVAFDDDFLVDHPASVQYSREFARRRQPKNMNRLYAIESRFSTTGAMADHRLQVRSEQIKALVLALTAEILRNPTFTPPSDLTSWRDAPQDGFLAEPETSKFVHALAKDLLTHQGKSILTVGAGQPAEVHALVHQLNALLQNVGSVVLYTAMTEGERASHAESIAALCDEMSKGSVSTLVILGGNPVYNTPAGLRFKDNLAKVKNSVHLSLYRDETSRACTWHVPRAHYLESWGDTRAYDGTVSLQQPLIKPLYNGHTAAELTAMLLGDRAAHGHELTEHTIKELLGAGLDADKQWLRAVHDGFVAKTAWATVAPARKSFAVKPLDVKTTAVRNDNGSLELTFWRDSHTLDGRFANNGWLQELPDFMSKLTWDNCAYVAPETATALGIEHQTLITIKANGAELTLPAYVMPGQTPGSIAVSLGYGRTEAGHVAGTVEGDVEPIGFNTYQVWHGPAHNFVGEVSVTATGKFFELGITQDHHALDTLGTDERIARAGNIIREGTVEEYEKSPAFAREDGEEHPPLKSLWNEFSYENVHRWGMAIDLTACVGCNACVVACQAENNIPIVGKEQVLHGRQMHWIRIDRYFTGDASAPEVSTQPMLCQQCEMAPCEQVCPVAATVHSAEGLNDMVYNRCIGTRYCSNNCPYKVRRFNFFNYHKNLTDSRNQVAKMVYNPEVTVRARGVMEKCNYCVQRIQTVKIAAHNAKRPITDGEIIPACAQACPAQAIVFGDLNDPKSAVTHGHADSRSYAVLEELNTKPRTLYLAKIKNPNPELS